MVEQLVGNFHGEARPASFTRGLAEARESIDERGKVGRKRSMAGTRLAVLVPAAVPPTVGPTKFAHEELTVANCRRQPLGVVEQQSAFRK